MVSPRLSKRVFAFVLLVGSLTAGATDAAAALDQLKTAYLFNFAKFVSWPDNPDQIVLCINTRPSTSEGIAALDGRQIDSGRTLLVRQIETDLQGCHMYFGTHEPVSERSGAPRVMAASVSGAPPLSISDEPGSLDSGFTFEFFLQANKLRFAVNPTGLEEANFQISSKLLQLARPLN